MRPNHGDHEGSITDNWHKLVELALLASEQNVGLKCPFMKRIICRAEDALFWKLKTSKSVVHLCLRLEEFGHDSRVEHKI